jgi:hypothetical protein
MRLTLSVLTVIVVGLLAGLVVGTGMAQYTALQLPPSAWILRHQAEDALFRRVMPPWWWLGILLPAVTAFFTRGQARVSFALAAVAVAIGMAITIGHEVPINRIVQQWSAANPPAEVDALRHSWVHNHFFRMALTTAAFIASTIGLVQASGSPVGP